VTKTVAITGASAGIGRAAARLFGQRGDRVALIARGHAGLETGGREADRPDNLWEPVDEPRGDDYGAHGEFDDRSHPRSVQLLISQHPVAGMTAAAATAAAGVAIASRARRR
jgi:NAD(P)-dependent dehydrogenase (short-subunit alcohol dehydrogenase family)